MTKEEVQSRVLHNGKPIKLKDFSWDEKTNTFSSALDELVLDFKYIPHCTFKTGSDCTFDTGSDCTFKTGSDCTFKTGSGCTFKTGSDFAFDTGSHCTFDTSSDCTFKTGSDCTFKTGSHCTFDTGSDCTFKTGSGCTFKTGSHCTFKTGSDCVIVRRDVFEVIVCDGTFDVKLLPWGKKGYIIKKEGEDYFHYPEKTERIEIIDSIVSTVIKERSNVLTVVNDGESGQSYIVTDGERYAHGKTIKEAKDSLIYKIKDRDTSKYNSLTLSSKMSFEEAVLMYRTITGSCESQTKAFAKQHRFEGKKSVKQIIEITKGQYNNELLSKFFKNDNRKRLD